MPCSSPGTGAARSPPYSPRPRSPCRYHIWNTFDDWSPDRRRFAYTAWNLGASCDFDPPMACGRPSVGIWDLDAKGGRAFLKDASLAAWSSDGRKIAAIRLTRAASDNLRLSLELLIADAASGQLIGSLALGSSAFSMPELYQMAEQDLLHPTWSPDSTRLLVVDAARNLVLVDSSAWRLRVLARDVVAKGVWASDGKHIAVQLTGRAPRPREARGPEIYLPPVVYILDAPR